MLLCMRVCKNAWCVRMSGVGVHVDGCLVGVNVVYGSTCLCEKCLTSGCWSRAAPALLGRGCWVGGAPRGGLY